MSRTASDQRLGRLLVFKYDAVSNDLKEIAKLEMAAVLDIKWCSHLVNGKLVFGVATADGKLTVFESSKNIFYKVKKDICFLAWKLE